jgi:hypothetical protein
MYAFLQQLGDLKSCEHTQQAHNVREVSSEMAMGNTVSSTEPRSGEGSPLD